MSAGGSAGSEHQLAMARAQAHELEARRQREYAGRMGVASVTERRTAQRLATLAAMGWMQLADRRWPGTRNANVDLLLVGQGGVLVVDTKCWKDVAVADGRIWRDQADVTDELSGLLHLTNLAEAELAEVGLAPGEVVPVVVLAGHRGIDERVGRIEVVGEYDVLAHVLRRGFRLTDHAVDIVATRLMALFPPMGAPRSPASVTAPVPEPVLPPPTAPTEEDLVLLGADDVRQAVMQSALAAPVEEWMTVPHPDQTRLVRRSFNGPARVRGAAGTGKTVVGLHRAAYLTATRPGRVLYTSYVRTLPVVLRTLFTRMSPATADRVDFVNVHRFALDLLHARGVRTKVNLRAVDRAYAYAWSRTDKTGPLKRVPQPWKYWQEEIDHVLKARGITHFEDYAGLVRVGRRYPLDVDQRRAVWELYLSYQKQLEELDVQDLSCVAVRLLHRLVGDAPDGLLLIGDGQQSVYPGGFTLAEAGVSVTGRASVLRTNYRNTQQILTAATAVVGNDRFSDLDGLEELGERDVTCIRQGAPPVVVEVDDVASHDQALLRWIEQTGKLVGVGFGDVAVLAARHSMLEHCQSVLTTAGVPWIDLEKYDGTRGDAVRLGTFKRAKGLEFKHVALPQLVDGPATKWTDEADDAYRERVELERRELFVGMTRARDGLWMGYVRRT